MRQAVRSTFAPSVTHPRRSLGFQAISLAVGTALAQGLTAAMYVVAARHAAPTVFGSVVAAVSVGSAGVGLVDFGTNTYWVRELASGRLSAERLGTRVAVKIAAAAVLGVVWVVVTRCVGASWLSAVAAPVLLTTVIAQTMAVFPRAAARSDLAALAVVLDRCTAFTVMMVLLFALGTSSVVALWVGLSCGALFGAVVCWRRTPPGFRIAFRGRQAANPWEGATAFGFSALANSGQTLDVAVLAAAGGSAAAGLYGAVSRWTQPMGLVVTAFSQASAPMIASAPTWEEAWARVRASLWLPLLAVLGCLGTAAAAPLLVPLLLGNDYAGSAGVLAVLALATVPAVVNQPLATFLQARGHQGPVSMLFVGAVALQLALVAALASGSGAKAGALALGIGQLVLLAGLVVLTWRAASPGRHR